MASIFSLYKERIMSHRFHHRKANPEREVESSPELRFPSDIPNPMIPHRIHRKSGCAPLSHFEYETLAHTNEDTDDQEENGIGN